jgi:hypothetical protein
MNHLKIDTSPSPPREPLLLQFFSEQRLKRWAPASALPIDAKSCVDGN